MDRTPEQWREYRARRREQGRPVARGGATKRKLDHHEWLAIDSEGCDIDGKHVLTHLVCQHSGGKTYTIQTKLGIRPTTALDFLLDCAAAHPDAICVWFSGGYDVTMLLQPLLTAETTKSLWLRSMLRHPDGRAIEWLGRFGVSYQPGRRFWLMDGRTRQTITIWDVFGFWQSSFVKALEGWLPDCPDLELIRAGKLRRGGFTPDELELNGQYCIAECKALCRLMDELAARMRQAGVRVNRWDGAGAIAACLLKAHKVDQYMAPTAPEVMDAARRAYFGGRIEQYRYGHHEGDVHHYDINSAYPSAMLDLPSMVGGGWKHWDEYGGPDDEPVGFALYRVRWVLKGNGHEIYPFPFRAPNGHISYPSTGEGWVWAPEYIAYLRNANRYIGSVDLMEAWQWSPSELERPFAWVEDVYALRQRWVKAGNPGEVILKKGLASLYGKLVQQIGTEAGKAPKWFQLEWGGWITSTTRSRVYEAAMQAPSDVIQVTTDGVYSTAPLKLDISEGKQLGMWEYKTHDAIIAVQSGVYWTRDGTDWAAYTRGYRQEQVPLDEKLTPERVLAAWSNNPGNMLATLRIECKRRFVGFGLVACGIEPFAHLGSWQPNPKDLRLYPYTKRLPVPGGEKRPWERLEPTRAEPNQFEHRCSSPHRLAWWPGEEAYHELCAARRAVRSQG